MWNNEVSILWVSNEEEWPLIERDISEGEEVMINSKETIPVL